MPRQRMEGFQKPATQPGTKEVGLAVIRSEHSMFMTCSCGWSYGHIREKVREEAAQRHLDKKHDGRGVWL